MRGARVFFLHWEVRLEVARPLMAIRSTVKLAMMDRSTTGDVQVAHHHKGLATRSRRDCTLLARTAK